MCTFKYTSHKCIYIHVYIRDTYTYIQMHIYAYHTSNNYKYNITMGIKFDKRSYTV